MNLFSISQLARYSGVKPHTIRIWEKRYNALRPARSEGNTRYYDNSQLRRILNIVSLMNGEYKLSQLCKMPDKRLSGIISEYVQKTIDPKDRSEYFISQLIAAGMAFDEPHFEKIFSSCLVRYGMDDTYTKVIYPMLTRIGLMWAGDSLPPANEHFISNIIKQKLFAGIDALPPPVTNNDMWLLFLREDEFHEIGLLFASFLIRRSGCKVIYLGSNVPFNSLIAAIKTTKPQHLLMFAVHNEVSLVLEEYLDKLSRSFEGRKIFVCGDKTIFGSLKLPRKLHWLESVADLKNELSVKI